MNNRAIIVAAGRGRRLGVSTEAIPKCMVQVAGRPILHWQLDALSAAGITDITIVRGYRGDCIDGGTRKLRFVENPDWARNNILASLMYAADEMRSGFFFSYSDIVFAPDAAQRLAAAVRTEAADAHLVVDRRWQDAYVGRTLHPLPEAELALVAAPDARGPLVTRVGKMAVSPTQAAGEFIGLAHFSEGGASALQKIWNAAVADTGLDAPFGRAAMLRNAYLTDALNAMADAGGTCRPVFIDGQWREIDTGQDLAAAESVVPRWT